MVLLCRSEGRVYLGCFARYQQSCPNIDATRRQSAGVISDDLMVEGKVGLEELSLVTVGQQQQMLRVTIKRSDQGSVVQISDSFWVSFEYTATTIRAPGTEVCKYKFVHNRSIVVQSVSPSMRTHRKSCF